MFAPVILPSGTSMARDNKVQSKSSTPITLASIGLSGLSALALAADSLGSSDKVLRLTGLTSGWLALGSLFILAFVRIKLGRFLPSLLAKISLWLGSSLMFATAGLIVWTASTPPNYVYSLTRLNPLPLLILSQCLIAGWLLNRSRPWWQANISTILLATPFWLLVVSYLVRLLPFGVFVPYATEDGLMEYLQITLILLSVLFAGHEAWRRNRSRDTKTAILFTLIALGMFVIGMEEISWGQRLIGWSTPTQLAEVNVQNETTLHNIGILNQLQLVGYLAITALGTYATWLKLPPRLTSRWWFWTPPTSAKFFYTVPFLFYLGYVTLGTPYHLWAEVMEVVFYAGLLIWILAGTDHRQRLSGSEDQ